MKLRGILGLFLLLWMGIGVNGEETISSFIQDVMTTFKLTFMTIVYHGDVQPPEICFTHEWVVLCLPTPSQESESEESTTETGKGTEEDDKSTQSTTETWKGNDQESEAKESATDDESTEESKNNGKFNYTLYSSK